MRKTREEDSITFAAREGQLAVIAKSTGSCNVPKDYPDQVLVRWVKNLRSRYNAGQLSQERIAMLEDIGFNFSAGLRGTAWDINRQLAVLKQFQRDTGGLIPAKTDANPEYAAVAQWVYRMRKLHNGGQLSLTAIALMEKAGINLVRVEKKAEALQGLADASFQGNYDTLCSWLDSVEDATGGRDLRYRDTKDSEGARKAYRFIEHMTLKSRQGILSDEHLTQLVMLAFTVNGRPIDEVLTPKPSIRSAEGVMLGRAQRQVESAINEARAIVDEAEDAMAVAEAKRDDALQVIRQASTLPPATPAGRETTGKYYLTAEELAERINYDPRTIRDSLKDRVFKEGRHYTRIGRKILWIWETIDNDMRDGTFRLLQSASSLD